MTEELNEEFDTVIGSLTVAMAVAGNLLAKLEKARKDLEKPPAHKWEHGDVIESRFRNTMICIKDLNNGQMPLIRVFCLSGIGCDCTHRAEDFLKEAKFLFNIKEKL